MPVDLWKEAFCIRQNKQMRHIKEKTYKKMTKIKELRAKNIQHIAFF